MAMPVFLLSIAVIFAVFLATMWNAGGVATSTGRKRLFHIAITGLIIALLAFEPLGLLALLLAVWACGVSFLFILAPEHTGLNDDSRSQLESTRTTVSNWAIRFLTWNGNYHTEHHVYPSMPFQSLPEAHRLMQNRLRYVQPGYVACYAGAMRGTANLPRSSGHSENEP